MGGRSWLGGAGAAARSERFTAISPYGVSVAWVCAACGYRKNRPAKYKRKQRRHDWRPVVESAQRELWATSRRIESSGSVTTGPRSSPTESHGGFGHRLTAGRVATAPNPKDGLAEVSDAKPTPAPRTAARRGARSPASSKRTTGHWPRSTQRARVPQWRRLVCVSRR